MKPVLSGQIIRWKDNRGFGFIQPSDCSQEVFIHVSAFKDVNRRPQVGDFIQYQLTVDKNGKVSACNALFTGVTSKIIPQSSSSTAPKTKSTSKPVMKFSSLALKTLLLCLAINARE